MTKYGGIAGDQLRQYIQRIERLEEDKAQVAEDIRDAFSEAKSNGYDPKIMRQVIKIRKMKPEERFEQETVLDTYLHALGMVPGDDADENRSAA